MNADGRADLIRRTHSGAVEVARSNGWSFGPFRYFAQCGPDEECSLTNLDEEPGPELVRINHQLGSIAVDSFLVSGSPAGSFVTPSPSVCATGTSSCRFADLDGDRISELTWVDAAGNLRFSAVGEEGNAEALSRGCRDGFGCTLAALDDVPGLDWVTWPRAHSGVWVVLAGLAKKHRASANCSDGKDCHLADVDGDGRADLVQRHGDAVKVWRGAEDWAVPTLASWGGIGSSAESTLWADINGDGVDDLLRLDDAGTVSVHPSFDARGRLKTATLALSVLEREQARLQAPQGLYSALGLGPPASVPDFASRQEALLAQVDDAVDEILAAIPEEGSLDSDADARWVQHLSMLAGVGRTIARVGPLGASARGEECGNTVVHELGGEQAQRQHPSYLFNVADGLLEAEASSRTPVLVDALTAVSAGMRCLNNSELQKLDAAYTEAVLETAYDLSEAGHALAPKWLIDSALPVALLSFDAVKYSAIPQSYQLFGARVSPQVVPGPFPVEGFDFSSASSDPECASFLCQTYGNARRESLEGRGLMLDQLGIWLPAPTRSGRLVRVEEDPFAVLENLLDLRGLGEGDCSLFEVVSVGFACRSDRTCNAGQNSLPVGVDPAEVNPGVLGGPLTHLLTPRDELSEHNGCNDSSEAGGGAGAAGGASCIGPALGSRRGRFSSDPVVDNLFRCAVDFGSEPVDVSIDVGDFCISGQDDEPDPLTEPTPEQQEKFEELRATLAENLRDPDSAAVDTLVRAYQGSYGQSRDDIVAAITGPVADAVEGATAEPLAGLLGEATIAGGEVQISIHVGKLAASGSPFDFAILSQLGHEVVHAVSFVLELNHGLSTTTERDHRVTRRLGWGGLCASGGCDTSCGAGDGVLGRFTECLDPGQDAPVNPDIRCSFAEDVCAGRQLGDMGFPIPEECTPQPPQSATNTECFVVQCGSDEGSLANACCNAEQGQGFVPPPLIRVPSPGPRPPRPHLEQFFSIGLGSAFDFGGS